VPAAFAWLCCFCSFIGNEKLPLLHSMTSARTQKLQIRISKHIMLFLFHSRLWFNRVNSWCSFKLSFNLIVVPNKPTLNHSSGILFMSQLQRQLEAVLNRQFEYIIVLTIFFSLRYTFKQTAEHLTLHIHNILLALVLARYRFEPMQPITQVLNVKGKIPET